MTGLRFTVSVATVSIWIAMLMPAEPALAAGPVCRQLEAELASGGGENSRLARKYARAITRQLNQMEIARAKASDAGCGFATPGAEAGECVALHGAIERMARNLGTLERQRSLISGDRKQPNAKLLAALEANDCRDEAAAERPKSETENDEKAVLTAPEAVEPLAEPIEPEITIIGIEIESEASSRRLTPLSRMLDAVETPAADGIFNEPAAQTYRTMCVRSCDGYFYPMSYAASTRDFERDEKRCEASCPGVTMELYYGETSVDDAARMQSTKSSKFYAELPTAFFHQKVSAQTPAGCVCNAKKGFDVVAGKPPRGEDEPNVLGEVRQPEADGVEEIKEPAVQPSAPSGSIVEIPLPGTKEPEALPADTVTGEPPVEDRKIRVVGPGFLPDQNGAIDLKGPVQPAVR